MENYEHSLFYRINSDALTGLYNYLSDSPTLKDVIVNELKTKYCIFDLSLMACDYIYKSNFDEYKNPFSINTFLELFN